MSLIDLIKDALPNLAGAVAGPAGEIVVSAISNKLGVDKDALESHIQNNPQILSTLSDFDKQMKSMMDVRDARQTEVEKSKSSNPMVQMSTPIIAIITVVMTFVMCLAMTFYKIPVEQNQIAIFILGFITSSATQIFSYYFGSSQSQDQNMNTIFKQKQ